MANNNVILRWGIENATHSAGKTHVRPGVWNWYFTGFLTGVALSVLVTAALL